MKRIIFVIFLIFWTFLFSCGISEQEEKELISFYETNYEFAKGKKGLFRSFIQKTWVETPQRIESTYRQVLSLDSVFNGIINNIDSSIKNNNFKSVDELMYKYNEFINKLDTITDNDKNFTIKRIELTSFKTHKLLFLMRMKNDLIIAYSNCLEYLWQGVDSYCSFGGTEGITTTSLIDTNGNTTITLHSKTFQKIFDNNSGVVNSLIIDGISKNGVEIKDDFLVLRNNAFADVKLKSLNQGKYKLKGKVRFYGYKGLRDYPFEHQFDVK